MSSYIGVSNAPKTITDAYIGVNNAPKEVVRAYIGVNNVPKLVYEKDWWTLEGTISDSSILGAYNFKGASSASNALTDLSGHGKTMTNSGCSWSADNGFYVSNSNYLDQSSLRSSGNIKSIVMKISGVWGGNFMALTGNWGSPNIGVWLKTIFETALFWTHVQDTGVSHANGNDEQTFGAAALRLANGELGDGVYGLTNTGTGVLYHNGSSVSMRNATATSGANQGPWTRFRAADIPRLVGGYGDMTDSSGNPVAMNGHFYISHLALYSIYLVSSQHYVLSAKLSDR